MNLNLENDLFEIEEKIEFEKTRPRKRIMVYRGPKIAKKKSKTEQKLETRQRIALNSSSFVYENSYLPQHYPGICDSMSFLFKSPQPILKFIEGTEWSMNKKIVEIYLGYSKQKKGNSKIENTQVVVKEKHWENPVFQTQVLFFILLITKNAVMVIVKTQLSFNQTSFFEFFKKRVFL